MNKNNFKEHKKSVDNTSVWFHYLYDEKNMVAQCKKCSRVIKVNGGSTSGLHTHLKTKHDTNLLKRKESNCDEDTNLSTVSKPKPSGILDYFEKKKIIWMKL